MQEDKYLEDEVDLREYIGVIFKRKWTIIIAVLISLGGGLLYNLLSTPIFESTATLRIGKAEELLISKQEASELLRSKEIISSAIEGFPIDFSKLKVETEDLKGTDLIELKVKYPNPELAMKVCKAISEDFLNKVKKTYDEKIGFLKKQLEELEKRKVSLHKKIESLQNTPSQESVANSLLLKNILSNYENISFRLEESIYRLRERLLSFKEPQFFNLPSKPGAPLKPKKKLVIAVSVVLGVFFGLFIAFFQEFWQNSKANI
ncbi:MAG TPA: hypothetical protein ENI31_03515 [Candidatus Omnitrophica bacterium]|nr:hypothetical protein [Candidatus Omnitrophota bacterium]